MKKTTIQFSSEIKPSIWIFILILHWVVHNCTYYIKADNSTSFIQMQIRNVTFEHSGVYTCAVMHNNQVRFISHQSLCVKRKLKCDLNFEILFLNYSAIGGAAFYALTNTNKSCRISTLKIINFLTLILGRRWLLTLP